MQMFLRLLVGGNLGLLVDSLPGLVGWGLVAAAVLTVANVALGSSHFKAYRERSDSVVAYVVIQFTLSAAIIVGVALAIHAGVK